MSTPTQNVINPKSLERQLKILDGRMGEVRAELKELEKMRAACQILLGNSVDLDLTAEMEPRPLDTAPAKPARRKEKRTETEAESVADAEVDPMEAELAPDSAEAHPAEPS